ncbi:unnamed protein product, partial [Protopolystoma xenopodis]
ININTVTREDSCQTAVSGNSIGAAILTVSEPSSSVAAVITESSDEETISVTAAEVDIDHSSFAHINEPSSPNSRRSHQQASLTPKGTATARQPPGKPSGSSEFSSTPTEHTAVLAPPVNLQPPHPSPFSHLHLVNVPVAALVDLLLRPTPELSNEQLIQMIQLTIDAVQHRMKILFESNDRETRALQSIRAATCPLNLCLMDPAWMPWV